MSECCICLRFWRRHPKDKSVRMGKLEPITLGVSGPKVEIPGIPVYLKKLRNGLWEGGGRHPVSITKKVTPGVSRPQ